MTNKSATLYIGVTDDLKQRICEHRCKFVPGFAEKYNIEKLIYFEEYNRPEDAIAREKQLKNWHRSWKLNLIRSENPSFEDLYDKI